MNYSLSLMLGRRMALKSLDPDASAYIAAVRAAGGTVSGAQATAINNYIVAEKAASRFTGSVMYFPIWGVAAANAIDLVSRDSATWVGGVTHASGYVQGNGTTGYLNTGKSFAGCGGAINNFRIFALNNTTLSGAIGGSGSGTNAFGAYSIGTSLRVAYGGAVTLTSASSVTGIASGIRRVSQTEAYRRLTSGRTLQGSDSVVQLVNSPAGSNMLFMAFNNSNIGVVPISFASNRFGAFGMGPQMSDADDSAQTTNLKTLWETCTGLTLA
jgi:hypothetical protein